MSMEWDFPAPNPGDVPRMSRAWAMPSRNTFSIPPIAAFLERWWTGVSVDPFAGDSRRAHYTNDLRPDAPTDHHLDASLFCELLWADGVRAGLVLFDPPYSPRQIAEVYRSVGRTVTQHSTRNAQLYREVRDGLDRLLVHGGIALSFGWNSAGFGTTRGYDLLEVLLVAHGGAHNDTICVAERKR